jgi:hypothetical protein
VTRNLPVARSSAVALSVPVSRRSV